MAKKKVIVSILTCIISVSMFCQDKAEKTALLIIDIQDFYFPEGNLALYKPAEAANNAALILDEFRRTRLPVIHVRHNYEPGGDINDIVAPAEDEKVFSKNSANSFVGTGLDDYLKDLGITNLILCGMQTHMCLEAATRAAADLGYKCTVISDACTTRDLKFDDRVITAEDVHLSTLATLRSYAAIISTAGYLESRK